MSLNLKKGRIFIRNLPFQSLTEEKIKSLFSKFGEINEINLPKNNEGKMKGFGFINYITKRDALKAINEMNNKKIGGRKILVSLAMTKNEYENEGGKNRINEEINNEDASEILNTNSAEKKNDNVKSNTDETDNTKIIEKPIALLNDPSRTLFIRNLGYEIDEERLKEFFEALQGNVIYAKIVRNKDTKISKGTGFVMFKDKTDLKEVLNLYEKFDTKPNSDSSASINPFELNGRNLKLFAALSKESAADLEKNHLNKKNEDKRNRPLLYYGLSASNVKFYSHQDISEEDQEKREILIKLKKTHFNKNPNLHVSETRLSFRNFDKTVNEDKLKSLISEKIEEYVSSLPKEDSKKYSKIKKIKQIKLLRNKNELGKDNTPKSKCVAFVEICDHNIAREIINLLSNFKINKKTNKGLIIDFALDDMRKVIKRNKKFERIKEYNQKKKKDEKNIKKTNSGELKENVAEMKQKDDNNDQKEKANPISEINDVNILVNLYHNTISRGKKQRIKKRLKSLGYNKPIDKPKNSKEDNKKQIVKSELDNYVTTKIENNKTNLNKKIVEKYKTEKKFLKNKRSRENLNEMSNNKKQLSKQFKRNLNEDIDDMNPYYSKILENLNK